MPILTCPVPSNINPLSPNGFKFQIAKLPELTYFCQEVNLPDVTLGEPVQPTPYSDIPVPGDKLDFGALQVQFLVDGNMANYMAVFEWINALGFPKNKEEYVDWITNHNMSGKLTSELTRNYSDATLHILTNTNTPLKSVTFRDIFPTSLGTISFTTQTQDVQYVVGNATFRYSYYEFT